MTHEANTQRIDWILRKWYWPSSDAEAAAKDILKAFGKRRNQTIVSIIAEKIRNAPRPWEAAEAILAIVNTAGNKRRRV